MPESEERPDALDFLLDHHSEPGRPDEDREDDPEDSDGDRGWSYRDHARASVLNYGPGADVFEHVAFLRVVGTADEIRDRLERLRDIGAEIDAIARSPDDLKLRPRFDNRPRWIDPEEAYGEIMDGLQDYTEYLTEALEAAQLAERWLEDAGFRYDDGKLGITGTGGRPRQVVREAISRTADRLHPSGPRYDAKFYSRVRGALLSVFPRELLTDEDIRRGIEYEPE
jgi:hypothetical protein